MDVEKTIEFILGQQAYLTVLHAKAEERGNRTDARLDRAVKLAIRDARNERKRRQEMDARFSAAQALRAAASVALDEKLTQLAAAQLVTEEMCKKSEEKWQSFLDFMRRGNGSH